jgi:ABC-type sugar transport system permease subunit
MATVRANTVTGRSALDIRGWWMHRQRKISPYLFISPFYILFLVFGVYPVFYSFIISFFKGFGFAQKAFYGLGNYLYLFQDERYGHAILNTTEYMLGSVFILNPLALLCALALNSIFVRWRALKDFYRLALFVPFITSSVVVTVIFARVFDTQYGLLNTFLGWFGVKSPIGWLSDTHVVMLSFILMGIWNFLGSTMLFWLAGLNGIKQDFYDAAAIDGANKWQGFWSITMPLLLPVTFFVVLQSILGSYALFAQPLLLTSGGPSDASLTATLYIYDQAFENFNIGYACAMAYVMVAFLLIVSLLNIKLFGSWGAFENVE